MASPTAQEVLEKIVMWANAHADDWPFSDLFGALVRATFARATNTFTAAVMLTREGYGAPATMLTRSLFEDAFVAYWMVWVQDSQWVVDRLFAQERYLRVVRRATAERHPHVTGIMPHVDEAALGQNDLNRYVKLFGDHGQHTWWANEIEEVVDSESDAKRYKLVEKRNLSILIDELESEAEKKTNTGQSVLTSGPLLPLVKDMRLMYEFVQQWNNQILHLTSTDVLRTVAGQDRPWARREGPSEDFVRRARGALYIAYEKLIYLMGDISNPELLLEFLNLNKDGFEPFISGNSTD
jgi:hypothetical protein